MPAAPLFAPNCHRSAPHFAPHFAPPLHRPRPPAQSRRRSLADSVSTRRGGCCPAMLSQRGWETVRPVPFPGLLSSCETALAKVPNQRVSPPAEIGSAGCNSSNRSRPSPLCGIPRPPRIPLRRGQARTPRPESAATQGTAESSGLPCRHGVPSWAIPHGFGRQPSPPRHSTESTSDGHRRPP